MNEIARLYLLPPVSLVVPLSLACLYLSRAMPACRKGRAFACAALAVVMLAATLPATSKLLTMPLRAGAPDWDAQGRPPVGAVVVPTGGSFADPTGRRWPTQSTLRRAALGAALASRHDLPFAISGGSPEELPFAEASLAVELLELDRRTVLLDPTARNTHENAAAFARLLKPQNVRTVLLVTDAIHMARMAAGLRAVGFHVYGQSLGQEFDTAIAPRDFLPSNRGLSYFFEVSAGYGGILYYLMRGRIGPGDLFPQEQDR